MTLKQRIAALLRKWANKVDPQSKNKFIRVQAYGRDVVAIRSWRAVEEWMDPDDPDFVALTNRIRSEVAQQLEDFYYDCIEINVNELTGGYEVVATLLALKPITEVPVIYDK